jgi:hypothetical protein
MVNRESRKNEKRSEQQSVKNINHGLHKSILANRDKFDFCFGQNIIAPLFNFLK